MLLETYTTGWRAWLFFLLGGGGWMEGGLTGHRGKFPPLKEYSSRNIDCLLLIWNSVEQTVNLEAIWDAVTLWLMNAVINQTMMLGEIRGYLTRILQVIGQIHMVKQLLFALTHWVVQVRSISSRWSNTNQGISRDALCNTGIISSWNTTNLVHHQYIF